MHPSLEPVRLEFLACGGRHFTIGPLGIDDAKRLVELFSMVNDLTVVAIYPPHLMGYSEALEVALRNLERIKVHVKREDVVDE